MFMEKIAKQLTAVRPCVAELTEYTVPEIADDEVLIKVDYAAPKHGTELAEFRETNPNIYELFDDEWKLFFPREEKSESYLARNVGNQYVGHIIEIGNKVNEYAVGDVVTSYGGIREYHIAKGQDNYRLRKLPPGMPWQNALYYDPAQFALGGVRDAHVRPGDYVAVFGLGAIGLIAVQMCKKYGASYVAAIDPIERRRKIAAQYGADAVFDPIKEDVGYMLKAQTGKLGVDAIIETSGSPHAMQSALRGLAHGGTLAFVACGTEIRGGLNFGKEAHYNYGKIVFSRASSDPGPDYPRWDRRRIEETCWTMLSNGDLDCREMIYPVVSLSESAEAYMKYLDKEPDLSIKMAVDFNI